MKNPVQFIAVNDYIIKLIVNRYIKDINVSPDGEDKGFTYYTVEGKRYKIPPVENPYKVIQNTIAGMLIMEGYVVVNEVDNTSVVSNGSGETYFITGNSCSCADRFSPCKHVFFANWSVEFRKQQVKLLHQTKN